MVKTVREIGFHEIKKNMVLRRYMYSRRRDIVYIVQKVVTAAQVDGNIEIQLNEAGVFDPPKVLGEIDYNGYTSETPFFLVGEQTEDGTVWYIEKDDPNIAPDPAKHDSYISGVLIGGEKVEIGSRLNGHEIHKIRHIASPYDGVSTKDLFIFHNVNDAVVYETHVKNQDFSIMYGFREMGD